MREKLAFTPEAEPQAAAPAPAPAAVHDFTPLLNNEEESDVCFEVQGRTLHAHRVLLRSSLSTDVFAAMLRHDTADSRTGRVPIVGVSFEAFSLLMRFLYTGALEELAQSLLLQVFRAAQRWLVAPLAAKCAAQLVARLTTAETLWEVLELLAESEGSGEATETLQAAAGRFMLWHVEALVAQPQFVERRAELAALLLKHAYPAMLARQGAPTAGSAGSAGEASF